MPKVSKRRSHSRGIQEANRRWLEKKSIINTDSSSSGESSIGQLELNDDDFKPSVEASIEDIADLFQFCKERIEIKFISVLLFVGLRRFGASLRNCDTFLHQIGGLGARTCQKWTDVLVNGDFDAFCAENRGGKRSVELYDVFPEIEMGAKGFSMEACRKTSGDFTAGHLANFIDNSFYEVSATTKDACDGLIRSVESCRLDLRRWGARFEANSQRPYFEGHERPDVVIDRRNFIDKFLKTKDNYYLVSDGDDPTWIMPTHNPPTILICQSEIK